MAQSEKGVELKVGLFVFFGLAVLAALVVQFWRVGEGFKHYYTLTVQFPDASGLLKGSDVLLAGAKIGRVSQGPRLMKEAHGVEVPLRIYDYVRIPRGAKFTVGASGLLGDRFVAVAMPSGPPAAFYQPNETIAGTRETGLDDLTREGQRLVGDLRTAVQNVNATVLRLNEQALSQGNMDNLKSSIEHLRQATTTLAETSQKFDGVVEKADATMSSAKKTSDDLQGAVADGRKMINAAGNVMREATNGPGLLPTMLSDRKLADDLRALISNLRSHGVLFYRNSAPATEAAPPRRGVTRP